MKSVSIGSASVHAMMRGTTRNLNESMDSASIPSICSVARISARTAPIPEPARPARSAVTSGQSREERKACTVGITAVAPSMTSVLRVCSVMTAQRKAGGNHEEETAPTSLSCHLSGCLRWTPEQSTAALRLKRLTVPAFEYISQNEPLISPRFARWSAQLSLPAVHQ